MHLVDVLNNQLETKGIRLADVARSTGSSKSLVTKFFSKKDTVGLDCLLAFINYISPNIEKKYLFEYFMRLESPERLIEALEYLSTHRYMYEFEQLLDRVSKIKKARLNDCLNIYTLQHEWQTFYSKSNTDFYNAVRNTRTSDDTLRILLVIMEAYHYYQQKEYKVVTTLINAVLEMLNNIKDSYVKDSYLMRIKQLSSIIRLRVNNNTEICRDDAKEIIDFDLGQTYTACAYYVQGLSYFYENFKQSMNGLNKAVNEYMKINHAAGMASAETDIALLHFLWGQQNEVINSPLSSLLNALLNNDVKEAHYHYNNIKNEDELFDISPTQLIYIEGLVENNKEKLYNSFFEFIKAGDAFFAKLPKTKLVELGENEYILDNVLQIHSLN